jgi:hypothetical protein
MDSPDSPRRKKVVQIEGDEVIDRPCASPREVEGEVIT